MEQQFCAIYDGKNIYLGAATAFEWPRKVLGIILEGKVDASEAFRLLGITKHEKLGATKGGCMGMLSNGRLTREDQIKSSIIAAMIQIEKKELY